MGERWSLQPHDLTRQSGARGESKLAGASADAKEALIWIAPHDRQPRAAVGGGYVNHAHAGQGKHSAHLLKQPSANWEVYVSRVLPSRLEHLSFGPDRPRGKRTSARMPKSAGQEHGPNSNRSPWFRLISSQQRR